MTPEEFVEMLRGALARHADAKPTALALTLVAPSASAFSLLRVRPQLLSVNPRGTRVYGLTRRQVEKALKSLEAQVRSA